MMSAAVAMRVKLARGAVTAVAGVVMIWGALFRPIPASAQGASPQAAVPPAGNDSAFEVAAIRPNTSGSPVVQLNPPVGGRFRAVNVTVRMLLMRAWRMKDFQITGGPDWMNSERFDISAESTESGIDEVRYRTMLQTLLADRFQLKLHRDSKQMPVYDLVTTRNGLKLPEGEFKCFEHDSPPPPPARGQPAPTVCGGFLMDGTHLEGRRIAMPQFVNALANMLGRPVIDQTHYEGSFDVHLEFAPEGIAPASGGGFGAPSLAADAGSDSSKPSFFTAIQKQMGLRIQADKAPVDILVIDRIEKPAKN
jgi:uncharacterized protein (TIGR03435 family)